MIAEYQTELARRLGRPVSRDTARCLMLLGYSIRAALRVLR